MKYIVCALLLVFASCNTEKKTQKYLYMHPDFSAGYCAEAYPTKDSVVVRDSLRRDTILELSFFTDTLRTDSFIYVRRDSVIFRTITNTKIKDSIIYRSNTAEEKRLQLVLQACQKNNNDLLASYNKRGDEINDWKGKARKRFWLLIFLAGAGAAYAAIKIKKAFV